MKKTAIYAIICAFALTFTSCQFIKEKFQSSKDSADEEIEAVYEDETYEIDDVIDPYDEEAYEKYVGKKVEKVSVEENKSGSGKDGILNEKITTSAQIDKLMDLYDADCEKLQKLMDSNGNHNAEIDKTMVHLQRVNEKLGDCTDLMSWQQVQRMLKQNESLEMLMESRR